MPGGAAGLQNQSGGRKVLGGFDSLPSPPLTVDWIEVDDLTLPGLPNVSTEIFGNRPFKQPNRTLDGRGLKCMYRCVVVTCA